MASSSIPEFNRDLDKIVVAICENDICTIRHILETSSYIQQLFDDHHRPTLLSTAAVNNSCESIGVLLEYGAKIEARDYSLIHTIMMNDNVNLLKILMEYNFDIYKEIDHATITHIICHMNNSYVLSNVNKLTRHKNKLIEYCLKKSMSLILALCCLYDGINVFTEFFSGCPLDYQYMLFWAILNGQNSVKILTQILATKNISSEIIREALKITFQCGFSLNAKLLFEYLGYADPDGFVIETYTRECNIDMMQLCLKNNGYDTQTQTGILINFTSLITTPRDIYDDEAEDNFVQILQLFVEYQFDLNIILDEIILYSYVNNYQSILEFVRKQNLDVHAALMKVNDKLCGAVMGNISELDK